HIYCQSLFTSQQLCQIDRESIGIKQFEGKVAVNDCMIFGIMFKTLDTCSQCTQERHFLFQNNFLHKVLLLIQFVENTFELFCQYSYQLMEKWIFKIQEGIRITHGTT